MENFVNYKDIVSNQSSQSKGTLRLINNIRQKRFTALSIRNGYLFLYYFSKTANDIAKNKIRNYNP